MLLAESLAHDWQLPQVRLFNSLIGVVLALLVALMVYGLERWLDIDNCLKNPRRGLWHQRPKAADGPGKARLRSLCFAPWLCI